MRATSTTVPLISHSRHPVGFRGGVIIRTAAARLSGISMVCRSPAGAPFDTSIVMGSPNAVTNPSSSSPLASSRTSAARADFMAGKAALSANITDSIRSSGTSILPIKGWIHTSTSSAGLPPESASPGNRCPSANRKSPPPGAAGAASESSRATHCSMATVFKPPAASPYTSDRSLIRTNRTECT